MANKYELITKLYEDIIKSVTGDIEEWKAFLECGVFNYKLRFDEQILLYAQKPEATAVAEIEVWNKKFHRWVNRGAKGIAVFENLDGGLQRLKHYFDITDTHEGIDAVRVPIWEMKPEYEEEVVETLEATFGELEDKKSFERAILSAIDNAVTDNIEDYVETLKESIFGSYLEGMDDDNLRMSLKEAVAVSASFMLMVRLKADTSLFDFEDFSKVTDFNTKDTLNVLGFATSDISQMALIEIAKTVRSLQAKENRTFDIKNDDSYNNDKEKTDERSKYNEYRISDAGRLPAAEPEAAAAAGSDFRQMGTAEEELPSESQESDILQSIDFGETDRAPSRDRAGSTEENEPDSSGHEEAGTDNRGTESEGHAGLGRSDEQHRTGSGGDSPKRADLQLAYYDRRTEDKSLPFFHGDKDIMSILKTTPHLKASKAEIRAFFETERDKERQKEYIKRIFNNDYTEIYIDGDRRVGYKTYQNVLHLWEGSYLSRTAESHYDWGVIASYFDSLRILGELYDEIKPLPSLEGQISLMEDVSKSSAFSFSQEIIDLVLTGGSGVQEGKFRIYEQFTKSLSKNENIEFLKKEYGWGGHTPIQAGLGIGEMHDGKGIALNRGYGDDADKILLKWNDVEKRIGELITLDRYLDSKQKAYYEEWLIKQEERKAQRETADIAEEVTTGKTLAERLASFAKETDPYGFYENFSDDVTEEEIIDSFSELLDSKQGVDDVIQNIRDFAEDNEDYQDEADSLIAELNALYQDYEFNLGDKVYIGSSEYEILAITDDTVRLFDYACPLINKEFDRADFEEKVRENPSNEHLIVGPDISEVLSKEAGETVPADTEKSQEVTEILQKDTEKIPTEEEIIPQWEKSQKRVSKPFVICPQLKDADRLDYKIKNYDAEEATPKEKVKNNLQAIELVKRLEDEDRLADHDEQDILAKYTGWGGLADVFDKDKAAYREEHQELKRLLTDEEYALARESTLTAFYTPPVVISAMYKALESMGFNEGNVLEPSCGIGNFMGLLPESMSKSRIYGVELDSITGKIAAQLYQKASVMIDGFERVNLHDSFFDIAIGNVPFGDFKVGDKRYDKHNFLIHDYFFAKTIDKVRPGGVIAFITSKGTMDKANSKVRRYIAQRAELIGAIRLPNNIFSKNAGTEVTSDIIFLQKRDKLTDIEPEWVYTEKDDNGIAINSYFVSHPEMILGEMTEKSGRFGPESTCSPYSDRSLSSLLDDAIVNLHAQISDREPTRFETELEEESILAADPEVRNFSYTLVDGEIYFRENSIMKPVSISETAKRRIKYMIQLRDIVRGLIYYQSEDFPESDIKDKQEELGKVYDAFTKKYGLINSRANNSAFSLDSSYSLLCALEILDEEGNLLRKADMFTKRTIRPNMSIKAVDTAPEALAVSIAEKAKVDMDFMIELTGKEEDEIASELDGVIFLDPEKTALQEDGSEVREYKTADEYLSGNVRQKLRIAEKLSESDDRYESNADALKKVQPKDLTASEISVRLGAAWLPPKVIEQFIFALLDTPNHARWNIKVMYSEFTGEWRINGKSYDRANVKSYNTYGTSRVNAYKIIESTLNLQDARVFDYVVDEDGKRKPVLNKKETAIARAKQEQIKSAFSEWIWKEPQRREQLTEIYNEKFNSTRAREYDGRHIAFVGMNPEIRLKPHQVNAVARILYGGNTLLAHAVGAGKTFEMVAAAMESKRLGLCNKSLFVVPNHLTEQWASEFLQLYPAANILVTTKKDFEKANRRRFCGRIATGDFDAVIMGHSQFEKIPMSIERQEAILQEQLDEVIAGLNELKSNRGEKFSIKQLEKTKKSIKLKLDKLNDQERKDDVVTFEELGIDRIFVDESHYYKNLFLYTKMRNVGGIAQTEAQKSSDLFMKCRYLDEITGGKGIVFATGTPISNSMVELYTVQRYLQYDTLKRNNLQHFDAWASVFGETVTAIELAPEGTGYRAKTRFAKFHNLPEIMTMFREVADIQTADMLNLPVPKAECINGAVKASKLQKEMVESLSDRAERVRNKMVDATSDNMLKITNDGRKLALDQRLINDMLPDDEDSKLNLCVLNIYKEWQQSKDDRLTQLVFCDLSTPKNDGSFNVYEDIRSKLIEKGIPAEEIKFIHEAATEAKKKELFGKVRSGDVRILLGSTQKMGAGTNVQDRLIALHDLDCPWRPSDLEQRSGRIIRQGNKNSEVRVFRYVTEGTFDSYLWQLVENKQKFIAQIMTSRSPVRTAEDVDETALSFAEIKMLATGNPHIKEKMDLDIKVAELTVLKQSFLSEKYALEDRLIKYFPQKIKRCEARLKGLKEDIAYLSSQPKNEENSFCGMSIEGTFHSDKKDAGYAILEACKAMKSPDQVHIGNYRGFDMLLSFDTMDRVYQLSLKHSLTHTTPLGDDVFGNITRLDNALSGIESKLEDAKISLENVIKQQENAKEEIKKPFIHEDELNEKTERLHELNALLDIDKREEEIIEDDISDDSEDIPEKEIEGVER